MRTPPNKSRQPRPGSRFVQKLTPSARPGCAQRLAASSVMRVLIPIAMAVIGVVHCGCTTRPEQSMHGLAQTVSGGRQTASEPLIKYRNSEMQGFPVRIGLYGAAQDYALVIGFFAPTNVIDKAEDVEVAAYSGSGTRLPLQLFTFLRVQNGGVGPLYLLDRPSGIDLARVTIKVNTLDKSPRSFRLCKPSEVCDGASDGLP